MGIETAKQDTKVIPAVNFHLSNHCNMRCKFCFSRFEDTSFHLGKSKEVNRKKCFEIIRKISFNSVQKITFVGGEPLLCPWLGELLSFSKDLGLTTMIVTNGSILSENWINANAKDCDWISLSVDSLDKQTNLISGRAINGKIPLCEVDYFKIAKCIKNNGIRLKINTTVSSFNWQENLNDFILTVEPERWKIFQVLGINGQNDRYIKECEITKDQFEAYVQRHSIVHDKIQVIPEGNEAMIGSYLMIDPVGRFFDNTRGRYSYSRPIWEVGWSKALSDVTFDHCKFISRKGIYDWS